jgi:D-inositol-3-phosphate glycosyltransferase
MGTANMSHQEESRTRMAVDPDLKTTDSANPRRVGLLTGCQDRPYAFGLAMALVAKGISLDVVGSDEIDSPELHSSPNLRFFNIRERLAPNDTVTTKLTKLIPYYGRLMIYVARSKPRILHILWNNKFESFDRTILMLYYKLCGKKITFTAHNVNQAKRDLKDSWLNRFTLRIQYRLCDHIFVHTQRMKKELREDFGVSEEAITIIRHPVNDAFPDTNLTAAEAKNGLGLKDDERTILFLGRLRPYKGIEHLLTAFKQLLTTGQNYRLVVAGAPNKGDEAYIDVLVLPYKDIFQSGVLFLAYTFGLPVVATDVGSFREEIVEGRTGFICKPGDPSDLAAAIERYFVSDIYKNLGTRRREIKDYANRVHSWSAVAELTRSAYAKNLGKPLQ